jgi:hypothetical protein
MKTCSKCGEAIDDQFDSCWKCAAQPEQATSHSDVPPLSWRGYLSGLFVAYLIPWLAVLLRAILSWRFWGDYPLPLRRLLVLSDFSIFLWMMIPAAISFLILWPFLRYRIGRRIASVVICAGWMYLEAMNHQRIHYVNDVV